MHQEAILLHIQDTVGEKTMRFEVYVNDLDGESIQTFGDIDNAQAFFFRCVSAFIDNESAYAEVQLNDLIRSKALMEYEYDPTVNISRVIYSEG
jgi:hypothetical protein